jgi:hypothetical protein
LPINKRPLSYSIFITALSILAAGCATTLKVASDCGNVQILSSELLAQEAESYCWFAISEREKVEAVWGATWQYPIRIHVDSSYRISMSLVPAYKGSRGFMQMPLRHIKNNTGPVLHEIVHIYAPNDNRFLAEGLAVYLHWKLAGNPSFPITDRTLKERARERLSEISSLSRLNRVRTPIPLSTVMNEQTAYILAGSFVGFLIEKYGLAEFKVLYETENYDRVYGKSLETLEKEWRSSLQGE